MSRPMMGGKLGTLAVLHTHLNHPSCFASYSWDSESHKEWVLELCCRLREDGVDVTLDQWGVELGDQLPAFMERGIADNDFVLIVCTPEYKEKADARVGGVGYEESVITAEVFAKANERKFIPVLARGEWEEAAPSWALGKVFVDLRGDGLPEPRYEDLLVALHRRREAPPPLGNVPSNSPRIVDAPRAPATAQPEQSVSSAEDGEPLGAQPISVLTIVANEVSQPRNDGSRGSALYAVPFQLSDYPSAIWKKAFLQTWQRPPRWTSMHRPGIARVSGDQIILDGTTIDEVKRAHKETLLLAVDIANQAVAQIEGDARRKEVQSKMETLEHEEAVRDAIDDIRFD